MWTENGDAVLAFQLQLVGYGWLDSLLLEQNRESGILGDITYQAVADVQLYYREVLIPSNPSLPALSAVMDAAGSFRDGSGNYYPIDEATYRFIMEKLIDKSSI